MGGIHPSSEPGKASFLRTTGEALALPIVLLLALGLRLYGIDFGLPILSNCYFRPDETLIVLPAVRFLETGGNPHFFIYPSLMTTVCAGVFHAVYFVLSLFGNMGAGDLAAHFGRDPSTYFLLARLVSVAAGTVTTALVYLLGRKLASRGTALMAALLYAGAPLAVRDAHFGVTDTVLALFSAAAVYLFVQIMCDDPAGRMRKLVLGAAMVGLAVSTKYTAFVLVPVGLGAFFLARPGMKFGKVLFGWMILGLGILAIFLVLNPYTLLDFSTFKADMANEYIHQTHGGKGAALPSLKNIFPPLHYGVGEWGGLLLCLFGLFGPSTRSSFRARLLLGATAVLFLMPMAISSTPFFRYAVPALPCMAVLAALGIPVLSPEKPGLMRTSVVGLLAIMALAPGLIRSVKMDRLLAREDTRILAGKWIEEHVPPGMPVVFMVRREREPQIAETRASMARRIEALDSFFGERGGMHMAGVHRLQLEAFEESENPRYEIFRNPGNLEFKAPRFCLVTGSYPIVMGGVGGVPPEPRSSRVIERARFESLPRDVMGLDIDRNDYFYLPFNRLDRVVHPGPNLEVFILRR